MTVGESASDRLFVGTAHGVASFTRDNGSWGSQQTFLPDEHISALIYEPTSQTLFAGTYGKTIHASKDLGQNWERRDQGIGDREIYSLAFQQVGGRPRLYAGTEPAHLFYSDDLGKNWSELPGLRQVPGVEKWTFPGPPHMAHVKDITFDPTNPDTIFAAVEVGGVLKTTDGGKTWSTSPGLNPDAHRVLIPLADPKKVYLVMPTTNCDETVTAGVCVSQNVGESWKSLTPRNFRIGYVDPILVHPNDSSLLFTAGAKTGPRSWRTLHTADSRVARSRDGGQTWEVLTEGLPEHIRGNIEAMAMDVWNGGFALFAGTTDGEVFCGTDEGQRWQKLIQGIGPVSKSHHYQNLKASAA
ncbi:MAG: glycosyl hydrolase [Deltaproteobacteria bacterium]|nr:glycosyl hydrolase [Deltaproteobacteria bacterium]